MAFDVQTLTDAARCAECLSPNQKQNVLLYLLNGILENGAGGGGSALHNLLSLTHPDTVPGPPLRGSLIVGNATPDWEALPIGAAGRVLRSDGVDATWSQLVLITDVTGILPIANGGTNSSTALNNNRIMVSSGGAIVESAALTNGQLLIGSTGAAPVVANLTAGANITITPGAGSISIAATGVVTQAYSTIQEEGAALTQRSILNFISPALTAADDAGNVRTNITLTHSALTKVDDTNVTLTLGGSPATALLAATSLTLGWTGTLSPARGGTGTGTTFTQGSVIFAGAGGVFSQDNANFFWDDTNNRLGIGTVSPVGLLHISGTDASFKFGLSGTTRGVRFETNATSAVLRGVDNTLVATFQPLTFGGSILIFQINGATEAMRILSTGLVGIGVTVPTALLHLKAGSATAENAPLKFNTGTSLTAAEVGAVEFTTDDLFFTITTGAARKRLLMADPVGGLTSGRVPFATTNGRLTDDADMTFATNTLTVTNLVVSTGMTISSFTQGSVIFAGAAGVLAQDNANFFWDDTNNWLGLGINVPLARLHLVSSAAATIVQIVRAAAAQSANLTEWQSSAAVVVAFVSPLGNVSANQLLLPDTSSATVGGILFGGVRFMHNFGTNNIFVGGTAGNYTLTGDNNASLGMLTLFSNTSGTLNIAVGSTALRFNTTGSNNSAIGGGSLGANTTGSTNSGFGSQSLLQNTTGGNNTAIGYNSLRANTTANDNVAIGAEALLLNTTGATNCAIGVQAMRVNLTGTNNTAIGWNAGFGITGANNVVIGASTINNSSSTGGNNVAIGVQALFALTSGSNNTIIGTLSGNNITSGSSNIVIGYDLDSPTATNSNTLTLGNLIFGAGVDGTGTTLSSGGIGIRVITPTAKLHLCAGTTAASTAPLKFNTGTSMTTAEAGAMEFTTDDLFFTITTGAARKRLLMADATAGLTSGKIPIATTNGRLVDLTASAAYTPTNVTPDRSYDADTVLIAELADVVGTMIADLQAVGILG